ncbi:NAD-dependent epimerase/dehydratase family protein [Rhizobium rhizosphaerae]|nr:NAD-dependent epimerase/dehydratase family protein [Xaviernesmea rhizosphaerae]
MQKMGQGDTVLVLGATGGIGGAMVEALLARGVSLRALHRQAARQAQRDARIDWRQGDAMVEGDVLSAAEGVQVIIHAVNPPGYRDWNRLVLPMLDNTIAAARATDATVLLPGNIYNFGPDVFPLIRDGAAQNPQTAKGRIRGEMEERLKQAAETGLRSIVLRAGDFFGPGAGNSWFGQAVVKAGQPVRAITQPGRDGVGHQWAYLPDVAAAMLALLDRRDELAGFEAAQFGGHWDEDGTAIVQAIRRVVGHPDLPVRRFPWWLLPLAAPFSQTMRELWEMRYLWRQTIRMDNARLVSLIGTEPHTPLDAAVRASLASLDCLKEPAAVVPVGRQIAAQ